MALLGRLPTGLSPLLQLGNDRDGGGGGRDQRGRCCLVRGWIHLDSVNRGGQRELLPREPQAACKRDSARVRELDRRAGRRRRIRCISFRTIMFEPAVGRRTGSAIKLSGDGKVSFALYPNV